MTEMAQPRQTTPRAELVTLSETDVGEVASFIAIQSGRSSESVRSHLDWFLLGNPAIQPEIPLGFGLRSADRLVGCILCSPQNFRFHDDKILFVGSSSFYVDEVHRGYGGRIFLQYSRLGRLHPLFGTSANPVSAALWKAAEATPIPYSDSELFGVLHWPPVVEELVHRRYASSILDRIAGSSISNLAGLFRSLKMDNGEGATLQPLDSAEQVMDLPIHASSPNLTALRDLPYIHWRYFSARDSSIAVFAYRDRHTDREILVTVNQRRRGHRSQINTLNVLDVYPAVGPEGWLRIIAALIERYGNKIDAVVLRGQNPDQQKLLYTRGFQLRIFDAPLGWFLDKSRPLPTSDWYPVPADGDAII